MKTLSAIVCLFVCLAAPAAAQDEVTFETSEATITTAAGDTHVFTVEVAQSSLQRARGLMFREELAEDAGMIFIYPRPKVITMWMRNTLLSLDMIFIDADGEIVRVARNTTPMSDAIVPSGGLAQYVLEVKAGTAERLGIAAGDQVNSPVIAD